MLTHPLPDPVVFSIGPLSVHWYGLMYLVAFAQFVLLARIRIRQPHIAAAGWTKNDIDSLLFYGVLGVIIGGRLGEVLFYEPRYYLTHPLEIVSTQIRGMSFHGGFLGVLVAMAVWAHRAKRRLVDVYDFIAPMVPLGYAAGRIGNFINAELPGRAADASLPWAMVWPNVDTLPRHPSPIYQALVDGLLLFVILWIYARKARPPLAVGALFVGLYGAARFFTEYFRMPDYEVHIVGMTISAGQMLSLPMVAFGLTVLIMTYQKRRMQRQYV